MGDLTATPGGKLTKVVVPAPPSAVTLSSLGVVAVRDGRIEWHDLATEQVSTVPLPGEFASIRGSSTIAHVGIATVDRRAWVAGPTSDGLACTPWNYTGWKGPRQAEVPAFDVSGAGLGIVDVDGETRTAHWWSPPHRSTVTALAISPAGDFACLEPDHTDIRSSNFVQSSIPGASTVGRFSADVRCWRSPTPDQASSPSTGGGEHRTSEEARTLRIPARTAARALVVLSSPATNGAPQ